MFSLRRWADTGEEKGWGTGTGTFHPGSGLHQHKLQAAKFFDASCSCLCFLTCRWSHGKRNPVVEWKVGSSVAILRKLENFTGGMYKIHDTVCPVLLIVILNSPSLELSSHFPFLVTAVRTKIYILSMKTEVPVEKLQLELWELCSWDSVWGVCVCTPSQEFFQPLEPTVP